MASHDSKGINLNYFSVCKIYYKILNYVQMYVHVRYIYRYEASSHF